MKFNEIKIQKLPQHSGDKEKPGNLAVLELNTLTFTTSRILYVYGAPAGSTRGKHSHHKNEQIVLCLQGQIDTTLWNGYNTRVFSLFPGDYVYVPAMIWDAQTYMTDDTIMMSIHSLPFDPEDHITDRQTFLNLSAVKNNMEPLKFSRDKSCKYNICNRCNKRKI